MNTGNKFIFLFISAIVTHLPKPKADKKRSLLGASKDSDEKEPLIEARSFLFTDSIDCSEITVYE